MHDSAFTRRFVDDFVSSEQNLRLHFMKKPARNTCGPHALRVRGGAQHSAPDDPENFQICVFIDNGRSQKVNLNL